MPQTWVKVVRAGAAAGSDDVYVNGNYTDVAGSIGTAFEVESGQSTFETLNAAGVPDWRKTATVQGASSADQAQTVTLQSVGGNP